MFNHSLVFTRPLERGRMKHPFSALPTAHLATTFKQMEPVTHTIPSLGILSATRSRTSLICSPLNSHTSLFLISVRALRRLSASSGISASPLITLASPSLVRSLFHNVPSKSTVLYYIIVSIAMHSEIGAHHKPSSNLRLECFHLGMTSDVSNLGTSERSCNICSV